MQGPSRCVLCKYNSEDTNHILFSCPFSQKCWEWLRSMLGWSTPFLNSLPDLLKVWPTDQTKGVYNKLWNICPSILIWEIWKERNRRIFRNLELGSEELISKIEASIVETTNSHLKKSQKEEGSFSIWDEKMKKNWVKLINPPLVYQKSSKEARENCRWAPP